MPAPTSNTARTPGAGETWRTRDQGGERVQVNLIEDEDGNVLFEEAKPGAVELRDNAGTPIGVPANPVHTELTDSAGAEIATPSNPLHVELTDAGGAELASPSNPAHVELTDSSGAELGTSVNPVRVDTPRPANEYVTPDGTPERNALVKGAAGTVYEVQATVDPTQTSPHYLYVFDDATSSPSIVSLVRRVLIPPGGEATVRFEGGRDFLIGVFIAISTDYATFTPPGSDFATFYARYD